MKKKTFRGSIAIFLGFCLAFIACEQPDSEADVTNTNYKGVDTLPPPANVTAMFEAADRAAGL
jgi:hypothetical protein